MIIGLFLGYGARTWLVNLLAVGQERKKCFDLIAVIDQALREKQGPHLSDGRQCGSNARAEAASKRRQMKIKRAPTQRRSTSRPRAPHSRNGETIWRRKSPSLAPSRERTTVCLKRSRTRCRARAGPSTPTCPGQSCPQQCGGCQRRLRHRTLGCARGRLHRRRQMGEGGRSGSTMSSNRLDQPSGLQGSVIFIRSSRQLSIPSVQPLPSSTAIPRARSPL